MKRLLLLMLLGLLCALEGRGQDPDGWSFITLWEAPEDGFLSVPVIGVPSAVYYRKQTESNWISNGKEKWLYHLSPGEKYYVKVSPAGVNGFDASDYRVAKYLLAVCSWGKIVWKDGLRSAFAGCSNLTGMPEADGVFTDAVLAPMGLEGDLSSMFKNCKSFNGDLSKWDVGKVTTMSHMFDGCAVFNGDLSKWNVSKVTWMDEMFFGCTSFNGDLSKWNVSKVTWMDGMFCGCTSFNGDLSKWDVSEVTVMNYMFFGCTSFNGDLSKWNVSKVTMMSQMFDDCTSFNGDLSRWDVSKVTQMNYMFFGCTSFNGDLSRWDVSKVTVMNYMFSNCTSFNGDLSKWDVSKVTWMNGLFSGCTSFNGDLSLWDVRKVTNMNHMFEGCASFDHNISQWLPLALKNARFFSNKISTSAWTAILENWGDIANNLPVDTEISVKAKHYSSANKALTKLRIHGWTIKDEGEEDGKRPDPVEVLAEVALAPNPFIGTLTITHAERVSRYCVLNAAGVAVAEGGNDGAEQLAIDGSQWPSGLYHIVLTGAAGSRTLRAVKR